MNPLAVVIKETVCFPFRHNSTTPLSAAFDWGFKFTNRQLNRKTRDSKMRVLAQTTTFTTFVVCQCSR